MVRGGGGTRRRLSHFWIAPQNKTHFAPDVLLSYFYFYSFVDPVIRIIAEGHNQAFPGRFVHRPGFLAPVWDSALN